MRARAINIGASAAVVRFHLGITLYQRHDSTRERQALQGLRILDAKRPFGPKATDVATMGGSFTGIDTDQCGPKLGELGKHKLMHPFADGCQ